MIFLNCKGGLIRKRPFLYISLGAHSSLGPANLFSMIFLKAKVGRKKSQTSWLYLREKLLMPDFTLYVLGNLLY